MASSKRIIGPGQSTVFTTRPVGESTKLFLAPWPYNPDGGLPPITWHIELCCQHDRPATSAEINISAAAGALVSVHNSAHGNGGDAEVWTDYI